MYRLRGCLNGRISNNNISGNNRGRGYLNGSIQSQLSNCRNSGGNKIGATGKIFVQTIVGVGIGIVNVKANFVIGGAIYKAEGIAIGVVSYGEGMKETSTHCFLILANVTLHLPLSTLLAVVSIGREG